jgi:hypothetical protein
MSTTATPFGLRVATHVNSDARPKAIDGGISSGYASSLYFGTPVSVTTNGTLIVATTTSPIVGMFAGCRYQPTATDMTTYTKLWPASQTYVTGSMTAWVFGYDDPLLVYEIQANGSVAQTALGDQANPVNPSSGTGEFSLCSLNSSLAGAGSSGTFRILDVVPRPNNAWGDSFTNVYVQVAYHQFYPGIVAV